MSNLFTTLCTRNVSTVFNRLPQMRPDTRERSQGKVTWRCSPYSRRAQDPRVTLDPSTSPREHPDIVESVLCFPACSRIVQKALDQRNDSIDRQHTMDTRHVARGDCAGFHAPMDPDAPGIRQ